MDFVSEREAINKLSEAICDASVNMFYTLKYLYSCARSGFYTQSAVKIISASLSNVTACGAVRGCSIPISPKLWDELEGDAFSQLPSCIAYSFAVRLPLLSSVKSPHRRPMNDKQITRIYEACFYKGAQSDSAVKSSFKENLRLQKKYGGLSEYSHEWLAEYLSKYCKGFDNATNESLFFFGVLTVYMPMFWDELEKKLCRIVLDNCII